MYSKRRDRNRSSRSTQQRRVLRIETLRERVVLDASDLGVADPLPWFDPGSLTYSYAPDGTHVAGEENRLAATFAQLGSETQWKQQFESAFDAWLVPLGASVSETADSGDPFGVPGRTRDDPRFGDIRIAAVPLSTGVLATSVPHSAIARGTWAGDILLNTDADWESSDALFSVVLHEIGHVLGLPHSSDPDSVMYDHGALDYSAPSTADIQWLRDRYAGVRFEDAEDDESASNTETTDGGELVPAGTFDPSSVTVLSPVIGSTVQYSTIGNVIDADSPVVFQLEPTTDAAKDLENLTIALHPSATSRLVADITVLDRAGQAVESYVLHHSHGDVVVQVPGVETDRAYFVLVHHSPTAYGGEEGGAFELVADLGPELHRSQHVGEIELDHETPVLEQSFTVPSSRLVHVHLVSNGNHNAASLMVTQLVDNSDQVLSQTMLNSGTSRSLPLTFLPAGEYRLRFIRVADEPGSASIAANVFIDDVSLDVGPPFTDPTGYPYLPCSEPGADPSYCWDEGPIQPGPTSPPEEQYAYNPDDFPWWYDYAFTCSDYTGPTLEYAQANDPLWWKFYSTGCDPSLGSPTDPADPPVDNVNPTDETNDPGATNNGTSGTDPSDGGPSILQISPIQNSANVYDVSGDGVVTPGDVLLVINEIARHGPETVHVSSAITDYKVDVNGDFFVTPSDALMVINALSRMLTTLEGESAILIRDRLADRTEPDQQYNDLVIGQLF